MRYVDYILDSLAPPWLQDGNGCAWMTGLGEEKDFLKQRIIDSIALRFPTYAPADSLPEHGIDRQIDRAPGETDASYRGRLLGAHGTWTWSGTDYGIMLACEAMGWQIAHVDAYDSWPSTWPYDGASIETVTWLGPGVSVAGTPVERAVQYTYTWPIRDETTPGQFSNLVLTGYGPTNTDAGTVYPDCYIDPITGLNVRIYADSIHTMVTARGALGHNDGGTVVLEYYDGLPRMSGTIDAVADCVAAAWKATIAITPDLTTPGVAPCTPGSSECVGFVLDSGVAVGGSVRVARRTNMWIVSNRDWAPPPGWSGPTQVCVGWPVIDYHAHVSEVDRYGFSTHGYNNGDPTWYDQWDVGEDGAASRWLYTGPSTVVWPACCAVGESALVFGGYSALASALSDETWVWDAPTDLWRSVVYPSTRPSPRHGAALCSERSGSAILFGGNDGAPDDETWRFEAGIWTQLSPVFSPSARYHAAVARLGGLVYLFGGTTDGIAVLSDTWAWDGEGWTPVLTASSPAGRFGHSMTVVGDRIVLFGGRDGSAATRRDVYTFDGSNWTYILSLDTVAARYWHGAAALSDHELLVWGGSEGMSGLTSVFVLDLDTRAVTALPNLPNSWFGGAHASMAVRRAVLRRGWATAGRTGDAIVRGPELVRGTAMTTSERDTMLASIRKWKGAHTTHPAMFLIRSPGGLPMIRGPLSSRGATALRGARVTTIAVGE
jgi:hypothetical protein